MAVSPSTVIPDSSISIDYNINELTEGTIDGKGVFDVMLKTVKAHLREEFDANRIRGTDYANMYTTAVVQVMQQASGYALAKSKMALELQILEAQLGKLAAETVVTTKQALLLETQALTQTAQTAQINAETRKADYITSFQLPAEIAATEAQTALITTQELQAAQQTLNIVAQRDQIAAQTLEIKASTKLRDIEYDIQVFNRDFKLPKELLILQSEVDIKVSQLALSNKELLVKQAQVDLATKEILLKQNQIDLGIKELAIKAAQVSIAEKELLIKAEQLLITKYELATKLPAEVALTVAQADLYAQKVTTELAQTDSLPIKPNSVIAINNGLIEEQGKSFLRSGQLNTAKILIDTWNVRHTADPDGNLETDPGLNLNNEVIGKAVKKVLEGIEVII